MEQRLIRHYRRFKKGSKETPSHTSVPFAFETPLKKTYETLFKNAVKQSESRNTVLNRNVAPGKPKLLNAQYHRNLSEKGRK